MLTLGRLNQGATLANITMKELLEAGGYAHPETATSTESEVRRMLRRLQVSDADTHLIMGMVRKLLWKVRSGGVDGK